MKAHLKKLLSKRHEIVQQADEAFAKLREHEVQLEHAVEELEKMEEERKTAVIANDSLKEKIRQTDDEKKAKQQSILVQFWCFVCLFTCRV